MDMISTHGRLQCSSGARNGGPQVRITLSVEARDEVGECLGPSQTNADTETTPIASESIAPFTRTAPTAGRSPARPARRTRRPFAPGTGGIRRTDRTDLTAQDPTAAAMSAAQSSADIVEVSTCRS